MIAPARRPARALLFIALCFLASAATRMGEVGVVAAKGVSAAAQAEIDALRPPEPTILPPSKTDDVTKTLAEKAGECAAPPGPLLIAIRERAAELDRREAHVIEREKLLEVAEARIRAEIGRLEEAEKKLAATLAIADGASERDVAQLVAVYEAMKAKDAAGIFNAMTPEFAAGFLARMRADSAAGILSSMDAGSAYAVTAVMAGRHVNVPLQ
jgi:flagellar motility protein MotE (MotC chaperone)